MENLTHYQRLVLEKLLPPLKKTEPYVELLRVSILFRKIKEIESDRVLFDQFKTIINNQLCFHLKSLDEFYELGRLKDNYEKLVKEFIDDNIDADENDFIEKYISSQNEIIELTFKYSIEIDDYESNKVRLNRISREDALKSVIDHNLPKKNNLEYFFSLVKIDPDMVFKRILNLNLKKWV